MLMHLQISVLAEIICCPLYRYFKNSLQKFIAKIQDNPLLLVFEHLYIRFTKLQKQFLGNVLRICNNFVFLVVFPRIMKLSKVEILQNSVDLKNLYIILRKLLNFWYLYLYISNRHRDLFYFHF